MPATRRGFLMTAATAPLAAAASAAPVLPTVEFAGHKVSRLIIGTNPMFGYSHFNGILDNLMREWMTPERRVETVLRAEQAGINTWQLHYHQGTMEMIDALKAKGSKMQMFLLSDFELHKDFSMIPAVAKRGFIGIAHHGNRTDEAFRTGQMARVQEFCKIVRSTGKMVGISTHNPEVVDFIESAGWDVDYYMTCLYRVSRTRDEARAALNGEAPLGETFLEKDPVRMTRAIRQTKKPCLAFKILGAGRAGGGREQIETAFKFAFNNIKPTDAVIVGMFPKFKDEMAENAAIVRGLHTT